jgi:quinol monooxygenase YgiN
MFVVTVTARVEPHRRHELMQMFQEISRPDRLPPGCLERRIYEESNSPTNLLLIEQWSETGELKVQLLSDQFRALIGAVKVLGKLIDIDIFEAASIRDLVGHLRADAS